MTDVGELRASTRMGIRTFRARALAELWSRGRAPRIDARLQGPILRRLDRLDAAEAAGEMALPGFGLRSLQGRARPRFTIDVDAAWCISFEFLDGDACRVDLERSHGGAYMAEHTAIRQANRCPTHPGALLREDVLPATGQTKVAIARMLGISRQHLYDILDEKKPVTANLAVRFGKLFGDGPGIWLRMQAAHDAWHAARAVDIAAIPTLARA